MNMPLVSVIIPTHNRARLLLRSLQSVLAQTFADLEVIVVENACTDSTSSVLDGVADQRLRRISLTSKCGASAARNAGVAVSRGAFIAFQDDDDIWLPEKLSRQIEALSQAGDNVGLCLCGYVRLTPNGVLARYGRGYFHELDFRCGFGIRDYSVIATSGWLVRRQCLDQVGLFDEQLPARNDWELGLRLRAAYEFAYVEDPLFIQDQRHETTMMRNEAAFVVSLRRIERLHGELWRDDRKIRARHAAIIGRHEIAHGSLAEGRALLRESLKWNPWQPKVAVLWLASLFGQGAARHATRAKRSIERMLRN